jgi:hypothetical protein
MKRIPQSFLFIGLILILLASACGPTETANQAEPQPTSTETEAPELVESPTPEPSATPSPPEENPTETLPGPTSTTGPQCTVVQDLNFRTGPGIAYRDPISVVAKDTVVLPAGYNPVGIPGGSWVLIEHEKQKGWIAAGTDFISCNFDLTTLPSIEVDPPPPPPPPSSVQSSDAEGGCGEDGNPDCELIFSDEAFIQFRLIDADGPELTQDHGILQVSFNVREGDRNGTEVYTNTETTSAYCIFGGNGPCNTWPMEQDTPVWYSGSPVASGEYFVEILATLDDSKNTIVRWAANFTITLP